MDYNYIPIGTTLPVFFEEEHFAYKVYADEEHTGCIQISKRLDAWNRVQQVHASLAFTCIGKDRKIITEERYLKIFNETVEYLKSK